MIASKTGRPEIIKLLWEGGASIVAKDISGQTAAHFAAQEDRAESIAILHELCLEQVQKLQIQAADEAEKMAALGLNNNNNNNNTSVPTTTNDRNLLTRQETTEEDIKANSIPSVEATIDCPSKNGSRPLHVAAAFASLNAIEILVKLGAEVNAQDNMRETAMHRAARRNYFECYDYLKTVGRGDETIRNLMGESPLDVLYDR